MAKKTIRFAGGHPTLKEILAARNGSLRDKHRSRAIMAHYDMCLECHADVMTHEDERVLKRYGITR